MTRSQVAARRSRPPPRRATRPVGYFTRPLERPRGGAGAVALTTIVSRTQDLKTHEVTHLGSERLVVGPRTRPMSKRFLGKVFLASQEEFSC